MATLILPDGSEESVEPKVDGTFDAEELEDMLGGPIEIIALNQLELLIVREDGAEQGLSYNSEATMLLRDARGKITGRQRVRLLVGPVLVTATVAIHRKVKWKTVA